MHPVHVRIVRSRGGRSEWPRNLALQTFGPCGGCDHESRGQSVLFLFQSRPATTPWSCSAPPFQRVATHGEERNSALRFHRSPSRRGSHLLNTASPAPTCLSDQ